MSARRAFWTVLAVLAVTVALLAFWMPLHGSDWVRLADDAPWPASPGECLATLLGLWAPLHAVTSGAAAAALVVGLTAHALGRTPRPDAARDVLALALTCALLFLVVPGAGATFIGRASVGGVVVGLAALVWLLAAYRLAGDAARGGGARAAGVTVLALVAGTGHRVAGAVGLVVIVCWLVDRRRRRVATPAWMWAGLVALAASLVGTWLAAPGGERLRGILLLLELDRITRQAGTAAALPAVLGLVLVARRRGLPLDARAIAGVLWAAAAGLAVAILSVLGPHGGEAALLPVLAPFVVASVGLLDAIAAADALLLRVLRVLAVAVNAVALVLGVVTLASVHHDAEARARALAAAAPGDEAVVPAYRAGPGLWFPGEDLVDVHPRALVAARHRLAEIRFDRRVAGYEAAQPHPLVWVNRRLVRDVAVARRQFVAMIRRPSHAELELQGLEWPDRRDRRVVAARIDGYRAVVPSAVVRPPDRRGRASFVVVEPPLGPDDEVHVIEARGAVVPARRDGDAVHFQPTELGHHYLVTCADADTCTLVATMNVRP